MDQPPRSRIGPISVDPAAQNDASRTLMQAMLDHATARKHAASA